MSRVNFLIDELVNHDELVTNNEHLNQDELVNHDEPLQPVRNHDGVVTNQSVNNNEEPKEETKLAKQTKLTKQKIAYLAICFCVIFCPYYVSQSFVSQIYPETSFIGWGLTYVFYAIGSIIGPSLKMSQKRGITLSSIVYIGYIASLNSGITPLYLFAACFVGFAAGVIWAMQGRYISRLAVAGTEGWMSGLFYSIFNCQGILGSLISLAILYSGLNYRILIWCMCGFCAIGFFLTFFIVKVRSNSVQNSLFWSRLKTVFTTFLDKSVLFLIPIIMFQSCQLVLSYQIMPKRIFIISNGQNAPINNVYAFLAYAVGSVIGSHIPGKIYDLSGGWKYLIFCIIILENICTVLTITFSELAVSPGLFWIIIGFFRGCSDYFTNTLISSSISRIYFQKEINIMDGIIFALYRCIYAVCFAPIAIISGYISYYYICGLSLLLLILGIIFYCKFKNEQDRLGENDFIKTLEREWDTQMVNL